MHSNSILLQHQLHCSQWIVVNCPTDDLCIVIWISKWQRNIAQLNESPPFHPSHAAEAQQLLPITTSYLTNGHRPLTNIWTPKVSILSTFLCSGMIAIPRRFDAFLSESNHFLALKVCMNDINDFPIKFKTQLSQLIKWQHGKKYLRKKRQKLRLTLERLYLLNLSICLDIYSYNKDNLENVIRIYMVSVVCTGAFWVNNVF